MLNNTQEVTTSPAARIDPQAVYHRKTIAWRKEENESISIKWGGIYHILNPTAAYLWESIDGRTSVSEVVDKFVVRYQPLEPDTSLLQQCAVETILTMIIKGIIVKPDSVWDQEWIDDEEQEHEDTPRSSHSPHN